METFKNLFLICLITISVNGFSQIGAKAQQGKIHGIWTNNDFGFQMMLMLNTDGSGEFDGEAIKFITQGDKLHITQQGATNIYTYVLQANSLKLSDGDLEKPIAFSRQGQDASAASAQTSPEKTIKDSGPVGPIPQNLLGLWSGYNETIEFKADAQCVYRGQPWPYTVANNHITLQTPQGNFIMAYTISGNQLNLTVNGQSVTYTKGASNTHGSTGATTNSGSKGLDMTLVGKWCYANVYSSNSGGSSSSECITLKQDGTYDYYSESSRSVNTADVYGGTASQGSDRGTWWVEGDRVFYNSQSSGQGSYKLEKRNHPKNTRDPMIVLDGKTYVTFYSKPAW
jgi:hypothetical protein